MTEEDDLIEELKKLPGNRPSEDRETRESDLKVRSLLNYPEVQKVFIDLARCNANYWSLTEQFKDLRKERDDLKAKVARLNSLLPKEEEGGRSA